ncbi:MAG: ABC transporter ATP-binding protein [Nitrospina sp.]|jgi:branched-chain amino acid transport system ATP-binding protein|nr:ABC transporter ATP-binding protein [Nitrospina sp.]
MLEVQNVDVFHGDIQALWDVSLRVSEGEMVALIGANGAGKTTLVETISGLLRAKAGAITFNNVRIDKESSHKIVQMGISLVPEEKGIFPGMSVLENLELGAFPAKSRKQKDETFKSVYGLFSILKSRLQQSAGTLSGGERTMLAIGRALMAMPKLLVLDEPSLGLAPLVVKSIFKVIQEIQDSNVSTLLVEQNVRAALRIATRAYIVENGRIAGHGKAEKFLHDEKVIEAYLGAG